MKILTIPILTFFGVFTTSIFANTFTETNTSQEQEITATINKNTTESELQDLVLFLKENNLLLNVKKQQRNENTEITAISLVLSNDSQQTQYNSSSNTPIADLTLGMKDGGLFITSANPNDVLMGGQDLIASFMGGNGASNIQDMIRNFGFYFDVLFDNSAQLKKSMDSIYANADKTNLNDLRDRLLSSFHIEADENGAFSLNGQTINPLQQKNLPKYSFIDKPSIKKIIMIDGKESSFETLDKLAKADQLDQVDFLKAATATSIYGKKAKDGAIIATTKK